MPTATNLHHYAVDDNNSVFALLPLLPKPKFPLPKNSGYDDKGDDVLKATTTEKTTIVTIVEHTEEVARIHALVLQRREDKRASRCYLSRQTDKPLCLTYC